MPRKPMLPQSSRHVMIYDEDWQFLEQHYGPTSANRLGTGSAVRQIVHAKVRQLRAAQAQAVDDSALALTTNGTNGGK